MPTLKEKITTPFAIKVELGLVSLIATVIFIVSLYYRTTITSLLSNEVAASGLVMALLLTFVLELLPQYVSPDVLFISGAVVGLSLFWLLIMVCIGSVLASLLGFELGRVYGGSIARRVVNAATIVGIERRMNTYGKWVVTAGALLPLPYVPLLFGALHMTRRNFILYGIIPRVVGFFAFYLVFLWAESLVLSFF